MSHVPFYTLNSDNFHHLSPICIAVSLQNIHIGAFKVLWERNWQSPHPIWNPKLELLLKDIPSGFSGTFIIDVLFLISVFSLLIPWVMNLLKKNIASNTTSYIGIHCMIRSCNLVIVKKMNLTPKNWKVCVCLCLFFFFAIF